MSDPNLKAIGQRIRASRTIKGLSQEQLAELLNVTPKFCGILERGEKGMSIDTLVKLKSALDVSTDYLLFGEMPSFGETPVGYMIDHIDPEKMRYIEQILQVLIDCGLGSFSAP